MKVYTAQISHKHGHNDYVAKTEDGLYKKLAQYCREWWKEAFPEESEDPSCQGKELTDKEIVDAYFEAMGDFGEYLDLGETELED